MFKYNRKVEIAQAYEIGSVIKGLGEAFLALGKKAAELIR